MQAHRARARARRCVKATTERSADRWDRQKRRKAETEQLKRDNAGYPAIPDQSKSLLKCQRTEMSSSDENQIGSDRWQWLQDAAQSNQVEPIVEIADFLYRIFSNYSQQICALVIVDEDAVKAVS